MARGRASRNSRTDDFLGNTTRQAFANACGAVGYIRQYRGREFNAGLDKRKIAVKQRGERDFRVTSLILRPYWNR